MVLAALLAVLPIAIVSVSAHSFVQQVYAGGQFYTGFIPWTDPYLNPVPARIVRTITAQPGDGPVLDKNSQDLACNQGGETGTPLVANVNAGSTIAFYWTQLPSSHKGPVSTYMTSCNGACSSFSTVGAKWFKIDAAGYLNGLWASTQLLDNNNTWTSTIPADLPSDQYLIRNEIIALHNIDRPQYYPSCSQLNVQNGGSGTPSASDLVNIPGIYDNVQFPNIYSGNFQSFPAPGPPVVSFTSSSQNDSARSGQSFFSGSTTLSPNPSSSQSLSTSSPAPSSQCRALKRSSDRRSAQMAHRRSFH